MVKFYTSMPLTIARKIHLPPHRRREGTDSPIKQRSDLLELRIWEIAPLSGNSF
jgi:hypothetical protein